MSEQNWVKSLYKLLWGKGLAGGSLRILKPTNRLSSLQAIGAQHVVYPVENAKGAF